ncbi:SRPBCC family protein [Staphylococcus capitis]|uniref:SRPBCC family protein n=1 Tax=Staphylococcus capitis TaxID=29388 RepID=UPI003CFFF39D
MRVVRSFLKILRVTTKPTHIKEAASVELPRDAATIWSFMWDPASSVKTEESTELGVTLPGTLQGLGEIQVFITRTADGRVGSLQEVVELDPGRRAVTRSLNSSYRTYGALTIEVLGPSSCRLTQEFWVDLPPGLEVAWVRQYRDSFKRQLNLLMLRLSELAPTLPT